MKSWNREIWFQSYLIALKFDSHLGNTTVKKPVKFQRPMMILTGNLVITIHKRLVHVPRIPDPIYNTVGLEDITLTVQHSKNKVSFIHICTNLTHWGQDKVAVFADDFFKCTFLIEHLHILIWIWLKFINNYNSPIDNKSALAQIMAWCRTGNKPLSEPMMA